MSGRAQQGRSQGEAQGGKKRRATPGRGVGGGACRAVPQEVPVEDFDAVAVVQSLVLPNSHLQPGVHTWRTRASAQAHAHAHATCARARVCTAHARHTHGTRPRPMHSICIYVLASLRLTKVPFCERSWSQASHTGWRSRGARCGVEGGRGHSIQWYKRMCRLEMYGMGLRVRAWLIGA